MDKELSIKDLYIEAKEELEFDMEAYAEVAQRIVGENEDSPQRIGELMLELRDAYMEGDV